MIHRREPSGMKRTLRVTFGLRVRALRTSTGESQESFADRTGIARSYMSRVERGAGNPSLDMIERIAETLGVEAEVLFQPPPSHGEHPEPTLVPFAADGSYFHPGLVRPRSGQFTVGEKSDPQSIASFTDALAYLRKMPTAKWRRPNESGNWGLVSAIRWAPLPK